LTNYSVLVNSGLMSKFKLIVTNLVEGVLRSLTGLKNSSFDEVSTEQMEFAFGMRREFKVSKNVRRKHRQM